MSLRGFHILFVTASTLLCLVFGGWAVRGYTEGRGTGHLVMAVIAFVLAVVLVVYGSWFYRKIRSREDDDRRSRKRVHPVPLIVLLGLLSTGDAAACSVCYGEATGPMIDAARLGVWLLFGLVFAVQVAFVAFFIQLRRRAAVVEEQRNR